MAKNFSFDGQKIVYRRIIIITVILVGVWMAAYWVLVQPYRPSYGSGASPELQAVRGINLLLFSYANDHDGKYPAGKSSTEVFQKLLDEKYVSDPTIFYLAELKIPGKTPATSNKLKPENVCWDVTVPVDSASPDDLPMVFATGFRVVYISSGTATPLARLDYRPEYGIPVAFKSNSAMYIRNDGLPDGIVKNFVSPNFDAHGKKYQQLTPDGPLTP